MQTAEARREYLRAWREKNREKWAEIKRKSLCKANGWEYRPKEVYVSKANAISTERYGLRSRREYVPSPIDLCSCGKKYLVRLGCLWCNGSKKSYRHFRMRNYGRTERTDSQQTSK